MVSAPPGLSVRHRVLNNKRELQWCSPRKGRPRWLGAGGLGPHVPGKVLWPHLVDAEMEAGPELGRPTPVAAEQNRLPPWNSGFAASGAGSPAQWGTWEARNPRFVVWHQGLG